LNGRTEKYCENAKKLQKKKAGGAKPILVAENEREYLVNAKTDNSCGRKNG